MEDHYIPDHQPIYEFRGMAVLNAPNAPLYIFD